MRSQIDAGTCSNKEAERAVCFAKRMPQDARGCIAVATESEHLLDKAQANNSQQER